MNTLRYKLLDMKWGLLFLSTLFFVACNNNVINPAEKIAQHRKPVVSTLFDDINLYTMEGVRPLPANAMFPFIDIQSPDSNTRRIVYQRAPGDSIERIYKKENGMWTAHFRGEEDGLIVSTWEYISPEKITELEYTRTKEWDEYHLNAVSLFAKDKSVTYLIDPKKPVIMNPVPTALDSIQNNISKMYLEDQQLRDGVLTLIDTEVDGKTKQSAKPDTTQWRVGKHSWFWWRQMYPLAEKIR